MGVETLYPMHRRNYPLLPHVKLNEPLMGTETLFCCWSAINYKLIHFVKLNDSLMGTETTTLSVISIVLSMSVALN